MCNFQEERSPKVENDQKSGLTNNPSNSNTSDPNFLSEKESRQIKLLTTPHEQRLNDAQVVQGIPQPKS